MAGFSAHRIAWWHLTSSSAVAITALGARRDEAGPQAQADRPGELDVGELGRVRERQLPQPPVARVGVAQVLQLFQLLPVFCPLGFPEEVGHLAACCEVAEYGLGALPPVRRVLWVLEASG